MGNQNSKMSNNNLYKHIDKIATDYILTQNFEDMKKLSDISYCNNLTIITSNIFKQHVNQENIQYLHNRIINGVQTKENLDISNNNFVFFDNSLNLSNLDISKQNSELDKENVCIGISKFYIKIAHLFSAIVTTINPNFVYKDKYGTTIHVPLNEKQNIPSNVSFEIKNINLCSRRVNALINKSMFDVSINDIVNIQPNICDINKKINGDKSLVEEFGIPELETLYYDKYNYETGEFDDMTDKTKLQYQNDVYNFYKTFTGRENIPNQIKKFSDISLRDYNKTEVCRTSNNLYNKSYSGSLKSKLFSNYAENVKKMVNNTKIYQKQLIDILNQVFITNKDNKSIINPLLNNTKLQELIENTREIIVQMYIQCEEDFNNGIKIFEAIVEKQIHDTTQRQIDNLKKNIELSLANSPSFIFQE